MQTSIGSAASTEFKKDKFGLWRQVNPATFQYDEAYKAKQSTNEFMAYLRLGWLAHHFGYRLKGMAAVDVGCGNGAFVKAGQSVFKRIVGYDLVGESISVQEFLRTPWDMAVLSDSLEHMPEIDFLFDIPWNYAFLSFPEAPRVETLDELRAWRHFKPDEHIWCLNYDGVRQWLEANGSHVICVSNFEDLLRARWDESKPNITSVLVRRCGG